MGPWARSALRFAAVGLVLYAALSGAAEWLLLRTGHSNPIYKIEAAPVRTWDWVILGASHAMPLDFGDFNERIERDTGRSVLNLAAPGTGPLYNRFVLDAFLERQRALNLLYVVDSFAFSAPAWNEERFTDAKLLRRTPWSAATARRLWRYVREEGVDPRALLDYAAGFSKLNNRERCERDVWEGEAQFGRAYRPSAAAVAKRMAYLFPDQASAAGRQRYLATLAALVERAQGQGLRVVAMKMPVPAGFRSKLPDEAAFDLALAPVLEARGVPLLDFSAALDDPRLYFDSDHLNREGLEAFLAGHLRAVLTTGRTAENGPGLPPAP